MMYKLMVVCVMMALTLRHGEASERNKRSKLNFGAMLLCAAKYSWSLNGYGCWCGEGDKGGSHVDSQVWSIKCCPLRYRQPSEETNLGFLVDICV